MQSKYKNDLLHPYALLLKAKLYFISVFVNASFMMQHILKMLLQILYLYPTLLLLFCSMEKVASEVINIYIIYRILKYIALLQNFGIPFMPKI